MKEHFRIIARKVASAMGNPAAFVCAVLLITVWAALGPFFGFSDTWQLVINTSTTIITFLMVFIIQNSQNRDGLALQLKLDELIRANKNARNHLIDLENLSEEELNVLHDEFSQMHKHIDEKVKEIEAKKEKIRKR